MSRENEGPMPDPLAYFITWATYGTWLPGDERGWVERGVGFRSPAPIRRRESAARMTERACVLNGQQRQVVEDTIAEHCRLRGWELHAVNCRSNHVHVVVNADGAPEVARDQFKAWCTRRLKERQAAVASQQSRAADPPRQKWWGERGSCRYLNDEESLEAAITYVLDGQDQLR